MPICHQCQQLMAQAESVDGLCPRCRPAEYQESGWSNIARVPNLAEAGYLVSILEHQQIEARLEHQESFSAATGSWSSDFVLQVPTPERSVAADLVRAEAEALRDEQPELDEFGEPVEQETLPYVLWRPVALMALAGLATLWLGQRLAEHRGRIAPPRSTEALAEAMAGIGRPLVATSPNGKASHRLTYWAANETWLLETDTNQDGLFDRRQEFAMAAED